MNHKLKMLCELYDRSDGDIDIFSLFKVCFIKDLKEILRLLSNKQCVKFSYLCAKSVSHLNNEKTEKGAEKCLKLVEKWLENPNSVSSDELRKVAYATYAIHVATNATYAAANAAYAAAAANAATYSANAAAAYVANAVNAATNAVNAAKNKQEQEYKNLGFLVKVIRDEP